MRLLSPESKSGAVNEGDHALEQDFNPIWGKARDLENMMRYNPLSRASKMLIQKAFLVSFSKIFPWITRASLWMLRVPKLFGGLGLDFSLSEEFKTPNWHR